MDWKIELIALPVADVDAAIEFYTKKVGFHLDHDHKVNENLRFVQLTPPGSACSIALGVSEMKPGSLKGIQVVVKDVETARAMLVKNGVEVSEIQDFDWGSFVFFSDPDGNSWALQQSPPRNSK